VPLICADVNRINTGEGQTLFQIPAIQLSDGGDYTNHNQFAQGSIALQYGSGPKEAPGGAIKWRKVQIKPM